jgi:hypothetical protein
MFLLQCYRWCCFFQHCKWFTSSFQYYIWYNCFSTTSGAAFCFSITDHVAFFQAGATSCFHAPYGAAFCLSIADDAAFVHLLNGKCNCTMDITGLYLDIMLLCSQFYSFTETKMLFYKGQSESNASCF